MPAEPYRKPSWRGIEFGVWDHEGQFGRATAVHEYPFRDPVWVEDLGRGTRRLALHGFRVGDDVAALELEMIEAAEAEGPGQLVHPTLGLLTVSLVEFRCQVRHDLGRVVELQFVFIEPGTERFPARLPDTRGKVGAAADALDKASTSDFVKKAGDALKKGVDVVRQVRQTIRGWAAVANRLIGDVRSVLNIAGAVVPGLDRRLSRFTRGFRNALAPVNRALRTVDGALGAVTRARAAAGRAVTTLTSLAGRL
jgi:prophage DNA circulation protein